MTEPKAVELKSDDLPAQAEHETSPLYRQEKFIYYYKNSSNPTNKTMYQNLKSDFSIFLVKLASSPLKKWDTIALDKGAILLGHQLNGQNIGLVNKVAIKNNKIVGLVIDANSIGLETNRNDLSIRDINIAVYSTYHALLRAAINGSFLKIRRNKELTSAITEWYHTMFLRGMSLPTLGDLEFAKFDFVIAYFLCRFMFLESHGIAFASAKDYIKKTYPDSAENAISDAEVNGDVMKLAKDFKDITKSFRLFEVTADDSMRQIQQVLQKIGTLGFITVTGPADYAISGIVLSMYYKGYNQLLMNNHQQSKIEALLQPYLGALKFGNM